MGTSIPEWGLGRAEATETLRVHQSLESVQAPRELQGGSTKIPLSFPQMTSWRGVREKKKITKFKDLSKKIEFPKILMKLLD